MRFLQEIKMGDSTIAERLQEIKDQIKNAEIASGRKEGCVRLCAVSKFHPLESVVEAMHANQFLFGENRVQEAFEKFTEIRERFSPEENKAELHIIGSLQSNKVKKAVSIASCIQSVDREELLAEIEKQCAKLEKDIEIYFELHTGEDSKAGYESLDALLKSAELCAKGNFPHIKPRGLMTMAPFVDDEARIRKSFSVLREAKEKINSEFPSLEITELSMGMSGDFKIAIEEGSTMVRIGTAIFGEREYK